MKIRKYTVLLILACCVGVGCYFFAGQLVLMRGVESKGPPDKGGWEAVTPENPGAPEPGAGELPAEGQSPPETDSPQEPVMATAHFARDEYRCDCNGSCDGWPCEMNPALLDKIEALRCACGGPVIITSGVRCVARNAEVGGVDWSFHLRGDAADLYCPGVAVGDLAQMAEALGMNILPYYGSGYIHVEI
ncbi:D-Ala-D-Ala carboxypeptidase family metallohydrolase [Eubacterium sp. 1001713B170207_170306_E7]|uniref:YcbK family protein n=1 Tax=Eubacterium sp. 1001713B170207_170306_E7 TaxID=2787097 RepID=UPI00189C46A7|nr:D-Ala-D-Ala carboxypeptidase family metallohydrolase [Eubacterium sp. 1001713B170207_170306_E7]